MVVEIMTARKICAGWDLMKSKAEIDRDGQDRQDKNLVCAER